MIRNLLSKSLLCGALAVFTVLTVVPQQAEAGPVRLRFTPLFGSPFTSPDLDWGGVVDIDDGACTDLGSPVGSPISNIAGVCSNEFSFLSATLTLKDMSTNVTTSISLAPGSGKIQSVQRMGYTPGTFIGATSLPFAPVLGNSTASKFAGNQAYFSLVLVGGDKVNLYWFDKDPGTYLANPDLYASCGKPGNNLVSGFRCGTSANTAVAVFQPVPEPATYALFAAGLGFVGFMARRRAQRS